LYFINKSETLINFNCYTEATATEYVSSCTR